MTDQQQDTIEPFGEHELVYFIRQGSRGPIKIGKTLVNARGRLGELQVGNPERLFLIGVTPGGHRLERALHTQLREHRIRGEWFRPDPEVLRVVREHVSHAPTETTRVVRQAVDGVNCEVCGTLLGTSYSGCRRTMCSACIEFADARDDETDPFEVAA